MPGIRSREDEPGRSRNIQQEITARNEVTMYLRRYLGVQSINIGLRLRVCWSDLDSRLIFKSHTKLNLFKCMVLILDGSSKYCAQIRRKSRISIC